MKKSIHLLLLVVQGNIVIRTEGVSHTLKTDDIFFIPKNTEYSLSSRGIFDHIVIHFDANIRKNPIAPNENAPSYPAFFIPQKVKSTPAIRSDMIRAANPADGSAAGICEQSIALLDALLKISRLSAQRESPLVSEMKNCLHEHIGDKFSLDMLVSRLSYTKQYLIRVFRRETGKTPIAYLNEMKLETSLDELLCTAKPIAAIAVRCGFDDVNYFTRLFTRTYGISPSAYRKTHFTV